jgi:hypothetical protein
MNKWHVINFKIKLNDSYRDLYDAIIIKMNGMRFRIRIKKRKNRIFNENIQ